MSIFLMAALVFAALPTGEVQAASAGPRAPTAYSNNNSVGSPENAYTSNDVWASFNSLTDTVEYTNFGFTIPTDALLESVVINFEGHRAGATTYRYFSAEVSTDGGSTWTLISTLATRPPGTDGTQTITIPYVTLAGRTWSGDGNFRVRVGSPGVSGTIYLDYLTVSITTSPRLLTILRQNPLTSETNADSLVFRATFNQPVQNVGTGDFTSVGSTASVTNVTAVSTSVYDVTVSGGNLASYNGTVGLGLSLTPTISDLSGTALRYRLLTGSDVELYTVDNNAPTAVSFSQWNPIAIDTTNADSLVFRAIFDDTVVNVHPTDFVVAGGSTASVTNVAPVSGSTYDLTVSGGDLAGYNGTVSLNISASRDIADTGGNLLATTEPLIDQWYTLDNNGPVFQSITRYNPTAEYTNADSLFFLLTFDEHVLNVNAADFVINGSTTAAINTIVSLSNSVYYLSITGGDLASFNGVVGIDLSPSHNITDLIGNPMTTVEPPIDQTFTVDNLAPVLNSFTRQNPTTNPTGADTLVIRATFNEAVLNVNMTDFTVSGATTAAITGLTPVSDGVYDLTISGGDLAGLNGVEIGVNLATTQDITDLAENPLANGEPAVDETYTMENVPPGLTSFTHYYPLGSPTNYDSLGFLATFTEDVTNVGPADFAVNGTTTAVVSDVTAVTGSTFVITVSGGDLADFNGVVGIDLSTTQDIIDLAGNLLPAGEPATDETYTLENTVPTVTVEQASGQTDPTNFLPIHFTVVFSETIDADTFQDTDLTLGGSAPGTLSATITEISPMDHTTFDIAVNGLTGNGTVTAAISSTDLVFDYAGNGNTASTSSDNTVTYDASNPSVVSISRSSPAENPTNADSLVFRVIFSEDVMNVNPSDFTVNSTSTAVINAVVVIDAVTYDIVVIGGDLAGFNGVVGLDISTTNDISDLGGNLLTAGEPSTDETYTLNNVIIQVVTNGVVGDGSTVINDGGAYTSHFNSFTITFNTDAYDPAGNTITDDVTNPNNYYLLQPGVNGAFDTAGCTGGVLGDDVRLLTSPVTYTNTDGYMAYFPLNGGTALADGEYRLILCGTTSIVSVTNIPLNNGADQVYDFTIYTPSAIPATGFAPGVLTALPAQQVDYTQQGGLTIEIPELGINESIVGVPLESDTWDVTWLGDQIGWLEGTAYPTWNGNSALTGHVYDANGQPGPFASLGSLTYGDTIIIHYAGQQYVYSVRASLSVSPSSTYWLLKHEDYSWLTLVTCQHYNQTSNSYDLRRVIRAVLVSVTPED
jgi:LPXTG-site transpeptidase (sortase) family protein